MLNRLKSIILCTVICLSVFLSGGLIGNKVVASDLTSEQSKATEKVVLNDFENFDRDIQLIRLCNDFGRIEQNTNEKFIKSGNYSLKVNPLGRRDLSINPFIVIPTFSMKYTEISFSDFTCADRISMWIYNDNESNVNVGVGFSKGGIKVNHAHHYRRDEMKKIYSEFYNLKPGWNYIDYEVRPELLKMQELKINEVTGIVLEFDYVRSHKLADSPSVYVDNVEIHYTKTPKSDEFKRDVKTGNTPEGNKYWQIADFETTDEAFYLSYHSYYPCSSSCQPVMKTAFAGDYGIKAKSGTQVYVLTEKPGDVSYGWPSIDISAEVIKNVFDAIGEDILLHPENYAFRFDMYNTNHITCGFNVDFEGKRTWSGVNANPQQWASYSMTFDKVNKADQEIVGWVDNGKGPEPILSGIEKYTENIGNVNLLWSRYFKESDEDRVILLDNFRIEKVK